MEKLLQTLSWILLILGILATFSLVSDANNGVTGNGMAIVAGIAWVAQSSLILIHLHKEQ